jgi:hypothetical protein
MSPLLASIRVFLSFTFMMVFLGVVATVLRTVPGGQADTRFGHHADRRTVHHIVHGTGQVAKEMEDSTAARSISTGLTSPSLPPWSLLWWQWLLSCVCWWLSAGVTCPTRTRARRETCQTFPLLLELLLGSPYGASRCLMSLALKEI